MSKLYEKLEYYAGRTPESKAFTYRREEQYEGISYAALLEYVNSLAASLAEEQGKTIAIIGNNKLEYAVSLLTVLSLIGDAFLIDKELGKEDILHIFDLKKPDLFLMDEELGLSFEEYRVLNFQEVQVRMQGIVRGKMQSRMHETMRKDNDCEATASFAGNLILHTSGTTGEPKCVMLTEENYYGVIPELNRKWEVTSWQSCLLIIPLYHIYALTSLFHGLYAGINNILEWDYQRLQRVLAETKPCLFMGVPLIYNRIKDAVFEKSGAKIKIAVALSNLLFKLGMDVRKKWFSEIHAYFGGNYVFGVSAGSLLPYETSRFFHDVGLPIYNVYGMTETSGPIAINYKKHERPDSVGEVLEVNEVSIEDANGDGVGRICVKGRNVVQGYLNDRKAEGFRGHSFDTGDLGYYRDGYLYVIGRRKNILIGDNGKNIAPEELNQKILKHKGIHDCNVILEKNQLIALVSTELGEQEVRRYLEKVNGTLPRYKRIADVRITKERIK